MAVAVFLALSLSIAANALFFQPRHHPSPLFDRHGGVAQEPIAPKPDEMVRAIQKVLAQQGLYAGAVDGLTGPQTEAAIRSFEAASGRVPTGTPSVALLTAILTSPQSTPAVAEPSAGAAAMESSADIAAADQEQDIDSIGDLARLSSPEAPSTPSTDSVASEPAASDPLVAAVQNALAVSAYGPITADGVVGPQTREAIMRFQRDHGLPETGEINDGLVVELRAAGALQGG